MRRKLAAVSADLRRKRQAHAGNSANSSPMVLLPLSPPQSPPNGRTRLQAARADALAAGREPPTRLPGPLPVYTPEVWKEKDKRRGASARGRTPTGTAPRQPIHRIQTVAQARRHIARLEEELEAAQLRLRCLENRRDGEQEEVNNVRGHRKGHLQEQEPEDGGDDGDDDGGDDGRDDGRDHDDDDEYEARVLPNAPDKTSSPHTTQHSSGLIWSLGAMAPVSDQNLNNSGSSNAIIVAKQQVAKDKATQGSGIKENEKAHENKNKKADRKSHWIGRGSKAAALAQVFFSPGSSPHSDSDSETSRKLDRLSAFLSDKYGGSHV